MVGGASLSSNMLSGDKYPDFFVGEKGSQREEGRAQGRAGAEEGKWKHLFTWEVMDR